MLNQKQVAGPDAEDHDGVAVNLVAKPPPGSECPVFGHRQRIDIADAAAVEIARSRMMRRMRLAPEIVRGQRQNADNPADPVIGLARRKQGAMAAIVLDHEHPDHQSGGGYRQQQRKQQADLAQGPHYRPQPGEGQGGDHDLENGAAVVRLLVAGKERCP